LSFKNYNAISKILKNEKPDLVITHNLMGIGIRAAQAIKKNQIPNHHFLHDIQLLHPSGLIMYGHESKINSLPAKIYQAISRSIIGSPKLIISPSRWLLNEHLIRGFFKNSNHKIKKLDDILQLALSSTKQVENNVNGKKLNKKLLFIGQMEQHKGILFLINAFKDKASAEMTLSIAGDGSKLDEAKTLANNDKRITFFGRLESEALKQLFAESDILIMPSTCYENYPAVILEAKNAGLKIVASNIGGIPEMIDNQDSLFIPENANDLFKKINQI
jgi:glycosyltransferase involved in cell wall biosynthesis